MIKAFLSVPTNAYNTIAGAIDGIRFNSIYYYNDGITTKRVTLYSGNKSEEGEQLINMLECVRFYISVQEENLSYREDGDEFSVTVNDVIMNYNKENFAKIYDIINEEEKLCRNKKPFVIISFLLESCGIDEVCIDNQGFQVIIKKEENGTSSTNFLYDGMFIIPVDDTIFRLLDVNIYAKNSRYIHATPSAPIDGNVTVRDMGVRFASYLPNELNAPKQEDGLLHIKSLKDAIDKICLGTERYKLSNLVKYPIIIEDNGYFYHDGEAYPLTCADAGFIHNKDLGLVYYLTQEELEAKFNVEYKGGSAFPFTWSESAMFFPITGEIKAQYPSGVVVYNPYDGYVRSFGMDDVGYVGVIGTENCFFCSSKYYQDHIDETLEEPKERENTLPRAVLSFIKLRRTLPYSLQPSGIGYTRT